MQDPLIPTTGPTSETDVISQNSGLTASDEKKTERRYHPDLPSLTEAQDDYTSVTSDHVPFLATIPLPENKLGDFKEKKSIKIVSWNVLQEDTANGLAPLNNPKGLDKPDGSYGETEEEKEARHDRIANSLGKFVHKNQPQFVTLQEISADSKGKKLYEKIQAALGEKYQAVIHNGDVIDGHTCITFYDKTQFAPIIAPKMKYVSFKDDTFAGNKIDFQSLGGDKLTVKVMNTHADFNRHPEVRENHIKEFLESATDSNTVPIVVGDFNCNIAPLDTQPQNITTSATVHTYRNGKLQGAAAIDGCFYSSSDLEGNRTCNQATTEHLNFESGLVYKSSDLPPIKLETLPELQRKEVADHRMVISVDKLYQNEKIINGEFTIFEYQQQLRSQFGNELILVRPARNLNNDDKIGLFLDKKLCQCIQLVNEEKFQYRRDINTDELTKGEWNYIFVDRADTGLLVAATNKIATNARLITFAENIKALESKGVKKEIVDKYIDIFKALVNQPVNLSTAPYSTILEHFIDDATVTAQNPNRSAEAIKQSAKALDEKLYGKPINIKVKTAICALLGALIGAVVGAVIGALATSWGGGFGSFVEAIEGASKGFSIGTAVGGGTAAASAATTGFFSATSAKEAYETQKTRKQEQEHKQISKSVEDLYTALRPTPSASTED